VPLATAAPCLPWAFLCLAGDGVGVFTAGAACADGTADAIAELTTLLGRRVSTAEVVREHHSHGESYHPAALPDVVCFPQSTEEVSAIMKISAKYGVPVIPFGGGTSISGAIDYARLLLAQCPCNPARRVIDISGDGSNNSGRPVTQARDEAVHDGVGINGLPILSIEPFLDRYYYDNVIGGPGAFMIPAENYDTFADAILKKLITEIAMNGSVRSIAIDPKLPDASQTRPSSRAGLTNSVKFVSGEPR